MSVCFWFLFLGVCGVICFVLVVGRMVYDDKGESRLGIFKFIVFLFEVVFFIV